ncbi:MAG: hypothetical protein ACK4TR_08825 [Phenylobacterium sp.]|uniref:hypothetical protein n=1 Tax=Phenylobacterium sp. TaxID=1871053 RepID=UPI00391A1602
MFKRLMTPLASALVWTLSVALLGYATVTGWSGADGLQRLAWSLSTIYAAMSAGEAWVVLARRR